MAQMANMEAMMEERVESQRHEGTKGERGEAGGEQGNRGGAEGAEVARLRARVAELEGLLFRIRGMGGHADEAPEEMFVSGFKFGGCDAWLTLTRVTMFVEADSISRAPNEGNDTDLGDALTAPVRYVRGDVVDALRARVAELETPDRFWDAANPDGPMEAESVEEMLRELRGNVGCTGPDPVRLLAVAALPDVLVCLDHDEERDEAVARWWREGEDESTAREVRW